MINYVFDKLLYEQSITEKLKKNILDEAIIAFGASQTLMKLSKYLKVNKTDLLQEIILSPAWEDRAGMMI